MLTGKISMFRCYGKVQQTMISLLVIICFSLLAVDRTVENIPQFLFDGRWTPENPNSKFPRLTDGAGAGGYISKTSTINTFLCRIYPP